MALHYRFVEAVIRWPFVLMVWLKIEARGWWQFWRECPEVMNSIGPFWFLSVCLAHAWQMANQDVPLSEKLCALWNLMYDCPLCLESCQAMGISCPAAELRERIEQECARRQAMLDRRI
jgi:hypothetical protein